MIGNKNTLVQRSLVYLLKRGKWMLILAVSILLTACLNSGQKELEEYLDLVETEITNNPELDEAVEAYIDLINERKPMEAIQNIEEKALPLYEKRLETFGALEFDQEDIQAFNEQMLTLIKITLDKQVKLKERLAEIVDNPQIKRVEDINEADMEALYQINEASQQALVTFKEMLDDISEEYGLIEVYDDLYEEDIKKYDPSILNEQTDLIITQFIAIVAESKEATQDTASDNQSNTSINEVGDSHVMMDAEVNITDKLSITGQTNLLEGSVIQLKSYHFTSENPYLKGETTVDENGEFSFEMDVMEEDLTGEPLELRLGYQPEKADNEEEKEIYGEEGEKIEGPLKQKYTDIKRTRYGAFTNALVTFTKGENVQFSVRDWDIPEDYGDTTIWIEKADVEVHDTFYRVTMKSNLNELTKIQASMEVPGYEVAGVRAGTHVGPDGSFQFQIQRPPTEIEEKQEILLNIEVKSDASIETEELYGEYGEHFAGKLAVETEQGKMIQYTFNIKE